MMSSSNGLESISSKIDSLESLIRKSLTFSEAGHALIMHGIKGYAENCRGSLSNQEPAIKEKLNAKIRQDRSLRYPHRKILEYMMEQYDFQHNRFREANFSRIVKECRLGKNKAGEYLSLLVERGYLGKRSDGYRIWYRILS